MSQSCGTWTSSQDCSVSIRNILVAFSANNQLGKTVIVVDNSALSLGGMVNTASWQIILYSYEFNVRNDCHEAILLIKLTQGLDAQAAHGTAVRILAKLPAWQSMLPEGE